MAHAPVVTIGDSTVKKLVRKKYQLFPIERNTNVVMTVLKRINGS